MKERYNRAFDNIAPEKSDSELYKAVLRKAENMKKENTRRLSIKKPVVAACAAVAVLGVGVTAAAATGLIDFNELFGGRIGAYNENVNNEVLAEISNVVVNSSSDEYTLELNGVISTGEYLAGSCELVRTDGTPVVDYMFNPDVEGRFDSNKWWTWLYDENGNVVDSVPNDSVEHYLGFVINDEGNISCNFHFQAADIISLAKSAEITFGANWIEHEGSQPCTMSIRFDYTPTEEALRSKTIVTDGKTVQLDNSKATVIDSRFDCLSGSFTLEYELANDDLDLGQTVALILSDGNEMPIELCSMTTYHNELGVGRETFNFVYSSELDGNITAFDIDDIEAVSINGTVFDLA